MNGRFRPVTNLVVGFLGVALAAPPAIAADAENPPAKGLVRTSRDYLIRDFPFRLWATAKRTWTGPAVVPIAVAGGLVPLVDDRDDEIRRDIQEERFLGKAGEDAGEAVGHPATLFLFPVALGSAGWLAGDDPTLRTASTLLEAVSVAGVSALVLKLGVGRERPDGSDDLSFPSNHAAGSFASATVLAGRYGWLAGVPAYLAAGFAAYARMEADKHFFSDTFFGAVLGTFTGFAALESRAALARETHTQARVAEADLGLPEPVWQMAPGFRRDGAGLRVAARW